METIHVAAALLSALLHAGWNAAVKASPHPNEAMIAQMVVSAALMAPALVWLGLPAAQSWPWIAASTALNLVTVSALLRAYALAGFGMAYPVVRAISIVVVVPATNLAAGETTSAAGLLGVGLVVSSLGLLAVGGARRDRVPDRGTPLAAFGWMLAAGAATALYVLADAHGARAAGSPWSYGALVAATNAIAMVTVRGASRDVARIVRTGWTTALPTALAAVVSYWLILWVWSVAPIAPAAALRDTSAIFAILIGVAWLREPLGTRQIGALALVAAAIPLLRLS